MRIEDVKDFVLKGIHAGRYLSGMPIPTIRQIVGLTGASHVTVWKALKELRDEHVLVSISRHLIKVADTATDSTAPDTYDQEISNSDEGWPVVIRRHWHSILQQLERDILNLHFEPGTNLPSLKQLQVRYHTSYRTIVKAINELVIRQMLAQRGLGWQVPMLSSPAPEATICFLLDKEYIERLRMPLHVGHNYLEPIEVSASLASIRVVLVPCIMKDDQLVPENPLLAFPLSTSKGPAILGYFHLINHPDPSRTLFEMCARTGKPTCIIDESGVAWEPSSSMKAQFRIFTVATTPLAGKLMAQHCIKTGHTQVGYFSVFNAFAWSIARMQGFKQMYQSAGFGHGVEIYSLETSTWWLDSWKAKNPGVNPEETGYVARPTGSFFESHASKVLIALQSIYFDIQSIEHYVTNMFETALRDPSISAWVAENDEVAMLAASFLEKKGIELPQKLSLLSFDNSQRAIAGRITSYSFAIPTIAHHAVRHVVEFFGGKKRNSPICQEFDGIIIERESSGRAPMTRRV